MKNILQDIGYNKIIGSQVEGTSFKKDLFENVVNIINKRYDFNKMEEAYAREEVYFPTIIWGLKENGRNIRVGLKKMFTWIPWKRKYTMNVRIHEIDKLKKIKEAHTFYAVKRVPRELNDNIRIYIRKNRYDKQLAEFGVENIKNYNRLVLLGLEIIKEVRFNFKKFSKLKNWIKRKIG